MIQAYSKRKDGKTKVADNFLVNEFACKDGTDTIFIDLELVDVIQKIREHFDKPVIITSGYRTEPYNKKVGGVNQSQHLYGRAVDIKINGVSPKEVAKFAETLLPKSGGIGIYSTFTHIDVREKKARW